MEFTYSRTLAVFYSKKHDKNIDLSYDFDYQVDDERILEAIIDMCIEDASSTKLSDAEYHTVRKITRALIVDNNLQEELEDKYHNELKEMFEAEALKSEGEPE